jgi:hypothetical protein
MLLRCVPVLDSSGGRGKSASISSSCGIASRLFGLFSSPSSDEEPDLPRAVLDFDLEAPLPGALEAVGVSG